MQASPSKRPSAPVSSSAPSVQASPSPPRRQKPSSLASIAIQSFAAFRTQTQQSPAPSPIRRKPVPAHTHSPAASLSPAEYSNPSSAVADRPRAQRSSSVASDPDTASSPPPSDDDIFLPRNLDENPHGKSPLAAYSPRNPFAPPRKSSLGYSQKTTLPLPPRHDRSASSVQPLRQYDSQGLRAPQNKATHGRSPTMPNMPLYSSQTRQPSQPSLNLRLDGVTEVYIDEDPYDEVRDSAHVSKPKSPAAAKLTSFFGWNSSKAQADSDSPTTTFSEKSLSPAVSPRFPRPPSLNAKTKLAGLDIPVANNTFAQPSYFNVPGTPLLSSSPQMNAHVEELERELREVSSELAGSIRRELELEDEVERWKSESSAGMSDNRRTSDYYSDSGTSSVRYPIGDSESKLEELETLRRKAEQERAQLKLHMAERLQDELRRRRDLEEQVQQLEEQVSAQPKSKTAANPGRVRELEGSLQDAQRRLAEERQVRENFEDLLAALRQELEKHRDERDNLRDEVVPQLKARLEGLESEASDTQTLIYESSRMQQEIQQLKTENQTLVNARRMQQEIQQQHKRFQSIAEETPEVARPLSMRTQGLSRSNSLARSGFNPKRGSTLSRSSSVKEKPAMPESPREGPHANAGNPVKELEEQRDALHKALKHLLQRQELQQRDFEKRIKELEGERDKALNLTPRRTTFHKEVAHLRDEVNSLRRRADDALEQKWQCEKGLGGLRMDLDRAQQETSSLRDLLLEHDITVPEIRIENEPMSLDKAYDELRTTHALSLARIKQMESEDSLGAASEEAEHTLDLLKRSISDAESERDAAQQEAEGYRHQARQLQQSEIHHLGNQERLSKELYAAATRMDDLSQRIQIQLQANRTLRTRLADAISRGEREQTKSTETIIELERRLKSAEDKVVIAQQSSEEEVSKHEEEIQGIMETHNSSLRRAKSGLLSPAAFSPQLPPSPFGQKAPRLDQTSSGPGMSIAEATKTDLLEQRVEELEKALRDADHEMEDVVGRMNMAQMEVAELQFERDEAMKQTRRLQADILAEREKVQALMA